MTNILWIITSDTFRLNSLQGYRAHTALSWRKKLNEQPKIEIHWIFCIFLVFALGCFSMCYKEQVLDYWSKIVLDQREFREKLLKAGNGTLFPCCFCRADTVSILNKLSERKVACKRIAWERDLDFAIGRNHFLRSCCEESVTFRSPFGVSGLSC